MKSTIKIKKLKNKFVGVGEVSGFVFSLLQRSKQALLYEVDSNGSKHYETFKIQHVKTCLDFDKKIFSDTELKEAYPKSNSFGVNAWTYYNIDSAVTKFNDIK